MKLEDKKLDREIERMEKEKFNWKHPKFEELKAKIQFTREEIL